ncbi:hypothetical protein HOY80DRAFT_997279 [Tuber brumale]|nr:hypothetical protein HOY80DRAFT_997279 [Tuber brumale]
MERGPVGGAARDMREEQRGELGDNSTSRKAISIDTLESWALPSPGPHALGKVAGKLAIVQPFPLSGVYQNVESGSAVTAGIEADSDGQDWILKIFNAISASSFRLARRQLAPKFTIAFGFLAFSIISYHLTGVFSLSGPTFQGHYTSGTALEGSKRSVYLVRFFHNIEGIKNAIDQSSYRYLPLLPSHLLLCVQYMAEATTYPYHHMGFVGPSNKNLQYLGER